MAASHDMAVCLESNARWVGVVATHDIDPASHVDCWADRAPLPDRCVTKAMFSKRGVGQLSGSRQLDNLRRTIGRFELLANLLALESAARASCHGTREPCSRYPRARINRVRLGDRVGMADSIASLPRQKVSRFAWVAEVVVTGLQAVSAGLSRRGCMAWTVPDGRPVGAYLRRRRHVKPRMPCPRAGPASLSLWIIEVCEQPPETTDGRASGGVSPANRPRSRFHGNRNASNVGADREHGAGASATAAMAQGCSSDFLPGKRLGAVGCQPKSGPVIPRRTRSLKRAIDAMLLQRCIGNQAAEGQPRVVFNSRE